LQTHGKSLQSASHYHFSQNICNATVPLFMLTPIVTSFFTMRERIVVKTLHITLMGAKVLLLIEVIFCLYAPALRAMELPSGDEFVRDELKGKEFKERLYGIQKFVAHACCETPEDAKRPTWVKAKITEAFYMEMVGGENIHAYIRHIRNRYRATPQTHLGAVRRAEYAPAVGKPRYITLVEGSLVKQRFQVKETAAIVFAADKSLEPGTAGISKYIWEAVAAGRAEFQAQCSDLKKKKAQNPAIGAYVADTHPVAATPQDKSMDFVAGDVGLTQAFGGLKPSVGYVIHAVGPNVNVRANKLPTDQDKQALQKVYTHSLDLAANAKITNIAFCPISTGNLGYLIEDATPIAIETVIDWLRDHADSSIEEVRFVCFNDPTKTPHQEFDLYNQSITTIKRDSLNTGPFVITATTHETDGPSLSKRMLLAESSTNPKLAESGGRPPLIFSITPKVRPAPMPAMPFPPSPHPEGPLVAEEKEAMPATPYITLVDGNLVEQVFENPGKAAIVNAANKEFADQIYGVDGAIRNAMGKEKEPQNLKNFEQQCTLLKQKKFLVQQQLWSADIYRADNGADNRIDAKTTEANYDAGEAGLTDAFGPLKDKVAYIINAVGPDLRVKDPNHPDKYILVARTTLVEKFVDKMVLQGVYQECLNRANDVHCQAIAFCAISTGYCGYDPDDAAPTAIKAVIAWLLEHPTSTIKEVRFVTYSQTPDEYKLYSNTFNDIIGSKRLPITSLIGKEADESQLMPILQGSTTGAQPQSPTAQKLKIPQGRPPQIFRLGSRAQPLPEPEKPSYIREAEAELREHPEFRAAFLPQPVLAQPQPPSGAPAAPQRKTYITLVDSSLIEQMFPNKNLAAIVNAANGALHGGDGIDGRIWAAVGGGSDKFRGECDVLRRKKAQNAALAIRYRGDIDDKYVSGAELGYNPGETGITHAFGNLANSVGYVIHAVGPDLNDDNYKEGYRPPTLQDEADLKSCYINSLDCAQAVGLKYIAFCPISTNIFKYKIELATPKALDAVIDWLNKQPQTTIEEIRFVTYSGMPQEYTTYQWVLKNTRQLQELTPQQAGAIISASKLDQRAQVPKPAPQGQPPLVFELRYP
jgi:O-acetyl-ADP-ribose deacetylase (regulator of RNase III)